jgi:aspartyl-tRNA synthetase
MSNLLLSVVECPISQRLKIVAASETVMDMLDKNDKNKQIVTKFNAPKWQPVIDAISEDMPMMKNNTEIVKLSVFFAYYHLRVTKEKYKGMTNDEIVKHQTNMCSHDRVKQFMKEYNKFLTMLMVYCGSLSYLFSDAMAQFL